MNVEIDLQIVIGGLNCDGLLNEKHPLSTFHFPLRHFVWAIIDFNEIITLEINFYESSIECHLPRKFEILTMRSPL